VSDKKFGVTFDSSFLITAYDPEIVSATDYYPFGMPSRVAPNYNGAQYRFGFNGKENDNDVKGFGSQQDYGMRIYDPRVGRFLSLDPLTKDYPELTPYQFASNTPIWATDLDGKEARFFNSPEFKVEYYLSKLRHPNASDWKLYLEAAPNALFRVPGVESTVRGLVAPIDVIEYTNRNSNQRDPKIRAENDKKAQQAGTDVIIGLGAAKIFGKVVQGGKMLYQEYKGIMKADPMVESMSRPLTEPLPSAPGGLTMKAKDLKLVHKESTILKSEAYQEIKKLSDKELIESVLNPKKYDHVTINTKQAVLLMVIRGFMKYNEEG
jgi:RHS repeat-associated protein